MNLHPPGFLKKSKLKKEGNLPNINTKALRIFKKILFHPEYTIIKNSLMQLKDVQANALVTTSVHCGGRGDVVGAHREDTNLLA
jgi:hypothetical protein